MKIELWCIGPTRKKYLQEGIGEYSRRIGRYHSFGTRIVQAGKSNDPAGEQTAARVNKLLKPTDWLVLLDERGQSSDSAGFARWLEKTFHNGRKRIIFLVGDAYGFHESLYGRSNARLSLSPMTFSHQMVRLIFLEQLYRAFTILANEPYHHQ